MAQATNKEWRIHTPYTYSASNFKEFIQAVADAVTAAAGDPGGCAWSVAANVAVDTNGRQIMLKTTDTNLAAARFAIYGGEPVNSVQQKTNQVSSTFTYASASLGHNSDTFDANFTSSTPMMSGGYISGLNYSNSLVYSTSDRIIIIEKDDTLLVTTHHDQDKDTVTTCMFGVIGRDLTNEQILGVSCSGVAIQSNQHSTVNAAALLGTGSNSTASTASYTHCYIPEISSNQLLHKGVFFIGTDLENYNDVLNQNLWKVKIPLHLPGGNIIGYAHQLYISRDNLCFANVTDNITGQKYICISAQLDVLGEAYYLQQPLP